MTTPINVANLQVTLSADARELMDGFEGVQQRAGQLRDELGRFSSTAEQATTATTSLSGAAQDYANTATTSVTQSDRLIAALGTITSAGGISIRTMRLLAGSIRGLLPGLGGLSIVLIASAALWNRWRDAVAGATEAAEAAAERTRAARAALRASVIPLQLTDTEKIAKAETELAAQRRLLARRTEEYRAAEERLNTAIATRNRLEEERAAGPERAASIREARAATDQHREALAALRLVEQNVADREAALTSGRAALAHNTRVTSRTIESFIRTLKEELAVLEKFPKEIKLGFVIDIEPLKRVVLNLREIKAAIEEIKSKVQGDVADLRPMVEDAFVAMADAIGTAVLRMGRGLKGFLGALAATAGQMARQLGRMVINAGLTAGAFGKLGVALSIFTKNPFAAIAIGAALVALGAALTAAEHRVAAGGGAESPSGGVSAAPVAERQGDLTIVFPKGTVFDPSNPTQLDAFVRMMEAAGQRRVIVRTI